MCPYQWHRDPPRWSVDNGVQPLLLTWGCSLCEVWGKGTWSQDLLCFVCPAPVLTVVGSLLSTTDPCLLDCWPLWALDQKCPLRWPQELWGEPTWALLQVTWNLAKLGDRHNGVARQKKNTCNSVSSIDFLKPTGSAVSLQVPYWHLLSLDPGCHHVFKSVLSYVRIFLSLLL